MSSTSRQNNTLVSEDWTRVYQSFKNANFQSYDFDNVKRVMINYLQENYPEDFNDYLDSSEYIALIDLIAFICQSISYRIDLNARDNFLELAERRESILRLAKLISYTPHRNIAASGLLKITSASTTQALLDSNGRNLAGQTIVWNDPANPAWYEQFVKVINAGLPTSRQFGSPEKSAVVKGIQTEQYRFQLASVSVPVFPFSRTVSGTPLDFEITSTTIGTQGTLSEEPPAIGNRPAFIFRNDNRGYSSANTGFFFMVKQGTLNQGTFTISQPSTSEVVDIEVPNINNDDVWLYKLDQNGAESELWAKLDTISGNNVIYNSVSKNIRNFFAVDTRVNDKISLVFSDGVFGTLPQGQFRTYYRVSSGVTYSIKASDIQNVPLSFRYISNIGQVETMTLTLSLASNVTNASASETNDEIKQRAPASYYTQDRMITGEDYNISPLAVSQEAVKIKAVNRSSAGISRFFDLADPTGKYSNVDIFASDGAIYVEPRLVTDTFSFITETDVINSVNSIVLPRIRGTNLRDFYYQNFPRNAISGYKWVNLTADVNLSTGYFSQTTSNNSSVQIGSQASGALQKLVVNSLVKFNAPTSFYFDSFDSNKLVQAPTEEAIKFINGAKKSIWTKITSVVNNGVVIPDSSVGPVSLSDIIPTGALIDQVIPIWKTTLTSEITRQIVNLIFNNKQFALRYSVLSNAWEIIPAELIGYSEFNLDSQGTSSDTSWLMLFTTDNLKYQVKTRTLQYVFESDKQVKFFAVPSLSNSSTTVSAIDSISVLGVNQLPNSVIPQAHDIQWQVVSPYYGVDGNVDTKKIEISFSDVDSDGVVDDPDSFAVIVGDEIAVLQKYEVYDGQEDYRIIDNSNNEVIISQNENQVIQELLNTNNYAVGQHFYFKDTKVVKKLVSLPATLDISVDYKALPGRDQLKFKYTHISDEESRIDPGVTNIVDIYVLTKQYDVDFRRWISGVLDNAPTPLTSVDLFNMFAPTLNRVKSISDEVVYHPAKYKVLFGKTAESMFRATFKLVKNTASVISDNDIKARVISSINDFFNVDNWDFGDSFHFSELATFVISQNSPYIVNFLIVPQQESAVFGSLLEIRSQPDQIFISSATVEDIEIIQNITASNIKAISAIV